MYDVEPNPLRRLLRPLAPLVGLSVVPPITCPAEFTTGELTLASHDGYRSTFTRAPAD